MKSFFKIFFASLLAIFVSGFLSVLMFIFSITAFDSLLSDETTVEVKDNSILKLTFSTPINDNPEVNSVNSIDFLTLEIPENLSLLNVLMSIEHAKNDHKIKGIYIEPSYFALSGFATIEEIRDALLDFKESGKFIISYADDYTQASYYMSSVADEIYINSVGSFGLKGLSTTLMFYKGLFEKLDIKPQIIRHGKYKSFIEPFTETEMSNENKKQTEELINSIWNTILTNISKERRLNPAGLSRAVSSLELVDPKLAVKFGLLDGIKHHDEVISQLMERVDVEKEKDLNFIGISDYSKSVLVNKSSDKIAIIYAEGDIVYGTGESGYISNKDIIKKFKKAKNDDDVKAIVFRINSGGGSALASELMWREIELVRQEKPVIVSFGNAAASGGYYIAAASDAIVCSPTTI
ncbi:MAG: S49 family peptidase, partial [Rikenellaceae bacterium]